MITTHQDTVGDLNEAHAICREAGRQEERQRILGEIKLLLADSDIPATFSSWCAYKDALDQVVRRIHKHHD